MRFRVLGPVQAIVGDRRVPLPPGRLRALLAALLLHANQVVTVEELAALLWEEGTAPASPRAAVQTYVGRLRRALGAGLVHTRPRGYLIMIEPDDLDLSAFRELVERAGDGDPAEQARLLHAALALWQDRPLADLDPDSPVLAEVPRLVEERLYAQEQLIDARLRLGEHGELVAELAALTTAHPRRERLWGQLMLALYRCGRQTEALETYRTVARVLSEEFGVDPGDELRRLHRSMLSADSALSTPQAANRWVPQCQLPLDSAGFVGRDGQLAELRARLTAGDAVPVVTISGGPGVGKSALAVRAAHLLRSSFPDGQWYARLDGAGDRPRDPADVLAELLRGSGVESGAVPDGLAERAKAFRARLADRRVLLFLDDARDADQVSPLLPGTAGCAVLVTSRSDLPALAVAHGGHLLRLDVLDRHEATALLAGMLGARTMEAEATAVGELVELCGSLPLALRIAAANVATRPERPVAGYVAELRGGNLLAKLALAGDPQTAVRAAFDVSYAALGERPRRLFRLLGLVPGPDFDAGAATALLGEADQDTAEALLDGLAAANLVQRYAADRFVFHDLLRLYAAEQARGDPEAGPARARLLDWYLRGVGNAADLLYPHMLRLPVPPGDGAEFDGPTEASAWLETERRNLAAAITEAGRCGPHRVAWLLADALRGWFWQRGHVADWLAAAHTGLAAAQRAGDVQAQAAGEFSLASLHIRDGRPDETAAHAERAIALARRSGWLAGEAAVLHTLGNLHRHFGRPREAVEHYARSLELDDRAGRTAGRAAKISNLGGVYWQLGELGRATEHYRRALVLNRESGNTFGEAYDLHSLGCTLCDQGQLDEALRHNADALALHRRVGDRCGEADALDNLAAVHRDAGRLDDALAHARDALAAAVETGDVRIEADALNTLGSIRRALGDHAQAAVHHARALELSTDRGDSFTRIRALLGLAASAPPGEAALEHARRALAGARDGGYRMLEGQALTAIAVVQLGLGRTAEAIASARDAAAIQRATGHRLGETSALDVLDRARQTAG